MSRLIRFVSILTLFSIPAFADTPVSGVLSGNTTWTWANSPYIVTGTVTVPNGVTLTIEQYVEVKFDTLTSLIVAGKLIADGVTFTSPRGGEQEIPGDWNGIEFQNTADPTSVFKNNSVIAAGGGANNAAIFYRTGAPNIPIINTTVRLSAGHGINTRASSPILKNCWIYDNEGFGVFSDLLSNFILDSSNIYSNALGGVKIPTSSSPQITNSYITNNGTGISIDNGASPIIRNNFIQYNNIGIHIPYSSPNPQPQIRFNEISNNILWGALNSGTATITQVDSNFWGSNTGPYNSVTNTTGQGNPVSSFVTYVPWLTQGGTLQVINVTANITTPTVWTSGYVYWVKNSITVTSSLTIEPGVVVKLASGVRITFTTGSLTAIGNQNSLIVFTSDKDDAYGGNTDTINATPTPGSWDRIEFNNFSGLPSSLKYCLFRYGGSGSLGNLYFTSSCSLSVVSNIFSNNSSNYGIRINNPTNPITLDSVSITGNANIGLYISGSTSVTVRNSTIQGNNSRGIYSDGSSMLTVTKSKIANNNHNGIEMSGSTTTLQALDSSIVSFNNGRGVYQNNSGSGPQRFSYNRIEGNAASGLWVNNSADTALFLADTLLANAEEGIVSTKANFLGNYISGNRYPIGLIGRLGSKYSGNTIVGNTFNKAVALRLVGQQFSDTLKAVMPSGTTSYVLIENSSGGVANGQTLVIEPGVIVKFAANMYMNISGTLIAKGTAAQPIVFTSHRDSSYGGKTIAANDFSGPAKGNWNYVQLTSTASNSQLRHCIFKYGGSGGNGTLYTNNVSLADTLANITVSQSSADGIVSYRTIGVLANVRSDSNNTHGYYIYGSSPGSDMRVLYSTFQRNAGSGLYADDGSAFREVSNCIIQNNTGNGITTDDGQIPQYYYGNQISFNGNNGIQLWNPGFRADNIQIVGNTISGNAKIGVVSTAAKFIDNIILQNNYPIGVWGRLGNIYAGNDSIANNAFNNAIAIQSGSLKDTLTSNFPAAIPSKAYHVVGDISVNSTDTLVIQPGTKIKFFKTGGSNFDFTINGTLLAEGTKAQPIIFTSWRDSTVGGRTSLLNDSLFAQPGQWNTITFYSGSGNSRVRNCEFRYGGGDGYGQVYFYNVNAMQFSNNVITKSSSYGVYIDNTTITLDTCFVEYNNKIGIYAYSSSNNVVNIQGCSISYNLEEGIYMDGNSKLMQVNGTVVANNNKTGLYVENNSISLTIVNSQFVNNGKDGLYINAFNNAIDTLILIAGTRIAGNAGIGAVTSRAYFVDDSISGNQFAIGHTGQLSYSPGASAFGTEFGNVYSGTYLLENAYDSIAVVEGYVEGNLGYSPLPGVMARMFTNRNDISVNSGKTLQIAPGAILKMRQNTEGYGEIYCSGKILAIGQPTNKIVFTSWKDDTYGGDTNKDTTATSPQPADWATIYLQGNDSTIIRNAIVKYAGLYGYGGIYFYNNKSRVDSSTISFNFYYGIYVDYGSPTIYANDIHNQDYGIYTYYANKAAINFNNIYQNSSYGLYSYGSSTDTIDARSNYWGNQDTTGPLVTNGPDLNPLGTGNKIYVSSGRVLYRPWLNTRQGILFGDVSGNGQISAFDASLTLQHYADIIVLNPVQQTAADVDGIGGITPNDASFILRYVVGIITGFPGLGKQSLPADAVSAFTFRIEKNPQPNLFDLVIHLNKPVNIFSAGVKLAYDTALVTPQSMVRGEASDSMILVHNFPKGKANMALAGISPLNHEGDIVRFTFKLEDAGRDKETVLFTVSEFLLNGFNVTNESTPIVLDVKEVLEVPKTFALGQNYPNPFNPTTSIKYQLPAESRVTISVYNILGQKVATLVNGVQPIGYYTVQWSGANDNGEKVASGVYIYRIEAIASPNNKFVLSKKMLLIK